MTVTRADVWDALLENRERAERVARARGARPDDVEDCVQEAMARVAAMPDVDVRRVGPLVTVVVANLAADGHRGRARGTRLERRLSAAQPLAEPPHDDEVCDAAEARWLWSLRGDLGAQDRRVLELRAQGLTLSEAAAELGLTYKAAENALGRARKRLKKAWAATAALLGILWGRRPVQPAAAAALPAAALALASLALLSPAAPPDGRPLGPDDATAAVVRSDARPPAGSEGPAAITVPAPPQPAPERAAPATPPPVPAAPSDGAPDPLVQTQPVEALDQQVGPVTFEEHEAEPSLVEEVERCLRKGPALGPYDFGCPP